MSIPNHHILIPKERIDERVKQLAKELLQTKYCQEGVLHAITVLEGGQFFSEKMITALQNISPTLQVTESFIQTSSYGLQEESTGKVEVVFDFEEDISGKNVVIFEDIIDTGLTLSFLKNLIITKKHAKSVYIVSLLDKPSGRSTDIQPDLHGFTIGDHFVFGCGLDYKGHHRDLPYVAEINE